MRKYYDHVQALHSNVTRALQSKSQGATFDALRELCDFVALAYDVALLKEVLTLQGLFACYGGHWSKAHEFYR